MTTLQPMTEPAAEPLVLVVEDDAALAAEVGECFQRYGFRVVLAPGWDAAIAAIRAQQPDAVLLDQHLAGVDAVSRMPLLREETGAPILVVTANADVFDRIIGLERGADDFLAKPVTGRELVARVRVALRRRRKQVPAARPELGGWVLDAASLALLPPEGEPVRVTATEYELLAALIAAQGRPVSRGQLSQAIRGRAWRPDGRSVDNAIVGLRRKLGQSREAGPIRTLQKVGYAFIAGRPLPLARAS